MQRQPWVKSNWVPVPLLRQPATGNWQLATEFQFSGRRTPPILLLSTQFSFSTSNPDHLSPIYIYGNRLFLSYIWPQFQPLPFSILRLFLLSSGSVLQPPFSAHQFVNNHFPLFIIFSSKNQDSFFKFRINELLTSQINHYLHIQMAGYLFESWAIHRKRQSSVLSFCKDYFGSWPLFLVIGWRRGTYDYFINCAFPNNLDRQLPHTLIW